MISYQYLIDFVKIYLGKIVNLIVVVFGEIIKNSSIVSNF